MADGNIAMQRIASKAGLRLQGPNDDHLIIGVAELSEFQRTVP